MGKRDYDFHYVYKTTNLISGKFYIGRRSTNKHPNLDNYLGSGLHFKRSLLKHGKKNFKKEVLEICGDFDTLCEREVYWQRVEKAVELGYNLIESDTRGGVFEAGKCPEEIRKKMSESRIGVKNHQFGKVGELSPQFGVEGYWKGKKISEEAKKKRRVTEINKPIVTCPHCGKVAKEGSNMTRYHFDNCKENPANNKEEIEKQRNESHHMKGKKFKKREQEDVTCPHCDKVGRIEAMKRWHFDNCKFKKL